MNCRNAIQQISGYLDGNLDEDLKHTLETHLNGCHHCKAVFDTTKKTVQLYCDGKLFELPLTVRERLHNALRTKWETQSK